MCTTFMFGHNSNGIKEYCFFAPQYTEKSNTVVFTSLTVRFDARAASEISENSANIKMILNIDITHMAAICYTDEYFYFDYQTDSYAKSAKSVKVNS